MALKMVKSQPQVAVLTETVAEHNAAAQVQTVKVETTQGVSAVEALTQEYVVLWKEAEKHNVKQLVKRMEEVRKALVSVANETMDAKQPAIFKCADGEIEFSERGTDTVVPDPQELITYIYSKHGADAAYSIVKIGITELRKILSPMEMKPYIKEEDGARTLKAVRPVLVSKES